MDWKGEYIVAEPIVAWRAWQCLPDGTLQSTGVGHVWADKPQKAECGPGKPSLIAGAAHESPQMTCACGYWAMKTLDNLRNRISIDSPQYAYGQVELWGRIVEATEGYRAEYARPINLTIHTTKETAKKLQERYKCPVKVIPNESNRRYLQTSMRLSKTFAWVNVALATFNFGLAGVNMRWFSLLNVAGGIAIAAVGASHFQKYFKNKKELREMEAEEEITE